MLIAPVLGERCWWELDRAPVTITLPTSASACAAELRDADALALGTTLVLVQRVDGGYAASCLEVQNRMYSMDDLLHVVHSDGADGLKLQVGQPPIIVIDGEDQPIEGPAITVENAEQLLHSVADSRQRRELREHGDVEFIYRFRGCASFVVHAAISEENVYLDIH
jgi:hypothetical protein